MAIARSCNRCGAPVDKALDPTPRLVVVPAASPSTQPIKKDLDCQIGLVTGLDPNGEQIDYCPPCLISVVMARVMPTAALDLATDAVETISAHRLAVANVDAPVEALPVEPVAVPLEAKG
jgi:hypothetical protein